MPQSRPHESSAKTRGDDEWEFRAIAVAAQLDRAAEELRVLVEEYRRRASEGVDDERPES